MTEIDVIKEEEGGDVNGQHQERKRRLKHTPRPLNPPPTPPTPPSPPTTPAQGTNNEDTPLTSPTSFRDPRSPRRGSKFFRRSSSSNYSFSFNMAKSPGSRKGTEDGDENASPAKGFFRRDSLMIRVKPGQAFTNNADIYVESMDRCNPKLGTLGELRHFMQTGSKAQVKKFIRSHNWPHNHRIRSELWKQMCVSAQLNASVMVYKEEAERLAQNNPGEIPQPSFLGGTIPVDCNRQLKHSGRQSLFRLLAIIEQLRPDITDAPLLYPLSAIMLHYYAEEEAYACLNWLLNQGTNFIMQTSIAYQASQRTMVILTKKHVSRCYSMIKKMTSANEDLQLLPIYYNWTDWIFRDLPIFHMLRTADCFMCEGQKVLFRVALAILSLWTQEKKKEYKGRSHMSCEEVGAEISSFASAIPAMPEKLLKVAFGIRNLALSTILELQKNNERRLKEGKRNYLSGPSVYGREAKSKQIASPGATIDTSSWESNIVTQLPKVKELLSWLPERVHLNPPQRLFSLNSDGNSFHRLWQMVDDYQHTLLLIKSVKGEIFGGYCGTSWSERRKLKSSAYFGTGETFLFRVTPSMEKYDWVGNPRREDFVQAPSHSQQLFQAADSSSLIIGGGGSVGLSIREELVQGLTNRCDTFENPPLTEGGAFEIEDMEAFTFMDPSEE